MILFYFLSVFFKSGEWAEMMFQRISKLFLITINQDVSEA